MGVDHELRQRAVNTRHSALEHHKPCARRFCRRFKIHRRGNAGDLEMLFRGEIKRGHIAPAANLDVVIFVGTLGHIISGQVGDARQLVGQLGVQFLGLGLHLRDLGLLFADQGAQAFEFGLVTRCLGRAHQFGGFVLFGLRCFRAEDHAAPRLVQRKDVARHRRIAAPCEGRVKRIRVFADGFDVMHGSVL